MSEKKKCKFLGCEKTIEDWHRYCKEHQEFIDKVKEVLNILDVHYHSESD